MNQWWMLVGAILAGPLWVLGTLWASRRTWRKARQLRTRAKGQEHLIELGHLVGGLAHEINNPLSTINVNLKLLAEDLARYDDEEHRRLAARLKTVQIENDRIKEILDDFLRFAGKHELAPRSVDLRRVIEELLDFFAPQAEASRIVMRSALSDKELVCRIDVNLIKQAVLNLMINAVQAMSQGGELMVKVSSQRTSAVIEVIDTGPGVSPENLQRIFHAYFSTKPRGSGLGLPSTYRIVKEHGGDIRAESEPGKGTRFIITLPLGASPQSSEPTVAVGSQAGSGQF